MVDGVEFILDLDRVEWSALKATLAADAFDNGRTPQQLRASFENSAVTVVAYDGDAVVGTARALSDGVCNAYVVDVWTHSPYRRRGIARRMMQLLEERLVGQHVILVTDDQRAVYESLEYSEEPTAFSKVVGTWLACGPIEPS